MNPYRPLSIHTPEGGGYAVAPESLEQFEISDERSTEEITTMLKGQGLEVVWKDWSNNWV